MQKKTKKKTQLTTKIDTDCENWKDITFAMKMKYKSYHIRLSSSCTFIYDFVITH